jgi:hypothetical protein
MRPWDEADGSGGGKFDGGGGRFSDGAGQIGEAGAEAPTDATALVAGVDPAGVSPGATATGEVGLAIGAVVAAGTEVGGVDPHADRTSVTASHSIRIRRRLKPRCGGIS